MSKETKTNGQIQITCSHCGGSGKVELSEWLQATLDIIQKHGPHINSTEIAEKMKWTGTKSAIFARANDLVALGLATRRRPNKEFVYSAVDKPS